MMDYSITWTLNHSDLAKIILTSKNNIYRTYISSPSKCNWYFHIKIIPIPKEYTVEIINEDASNENIFEIISVDNYMLNVFLSRENYDANVNVKTKFISSDLSEDNNLNFNKNVETCHIVKWNVPNVIDFKIKLELIFNYSVSDLAVPQNALSVSDLAVPQNTLSVSENNAPKVDSLFEYKLTEKGIEKPADFTLICYGGGVSITIHKIKVHKSILSAKSRYFETLFKKSKKSRHAIVANKFGNTIRQDITDELALPDLNPHVLRHTLDYMYDKQFTIESVEQARRLFYPATRYSVKGLKPFIAEYLISTLSLSNAFKLLEIANLYDEKLKADIMYFISCHYNFPCIKNGFNILYRKNPKLAADLRRYTQLF